MSSLRQSKIFAKILVHKVPPAWELDERERRFSIRTQKEKIFCALRESVI